MGPYLKKEKYMEAATVYLQEIGTNAGIVTKIMKFLHPG